MENMIREEMLSCLEFIKSKHNFIEKISYFPVSCELIIIDMHIKKDNYILLKLLGYDFEDKIKNDISIKIKSLTNFNHCFTRFHIAPKQPINHNKEKKYNGIWSIIISWIYKR